MTPSKTLAVIGNPIAFYPGLVPITGSIKATLMFCQIFYWSQRTTNPLGVYKSVSDFEEEIHLTYKEQIAARKKLVEIGLISEDYDRANHRVYFLVHLEKLDELLLMQELEHDQKAHDKKSGGTCQKVSYHMTKSKFANTENTAKTTPASTKTDYAALFDVFWQTYPKKVGKDAAMKAFDKRKPTQELLDKMVKAINIQKTTDQWAKDKGRYIPNPSTWLNQGRFDDELPQEGGNSGSGDDYGRFV